MVLEKQRRPALAVAVFVLLAAADQLTKYLAQRALKGHAALPLIRNVLELRYLENRGAAFGMLQDRQWVFILFAVLMIAGCVFYYFRLPANAKFRAMRLCLCVLAAGAAGNLIDRLSRGYVVDFIYFSLIDFPIFNMADICVTLSVAALVILVLFCYKEEDYGETSGRG